MQPQVAARRRHGRRDLRRHRDPPAARFRRSLDAARPRIARGSGGRARARSPGGSSAAPARPTGSTAATSAPRTSPCCSPTPRPARIRRRWSARARSARSSRPSRSNGACCWRRRQAFPGFTRGARTPSRSFAQPRPISPASARSSASRSSVRRSSGGRRAPPSATGNSPMKSASLEARLLHARWFEAEQAAAAANAEAAARRRKSTAIQAGIAEAQKAQEQRAIRSPRAECARRDPRGRA